MLDAKNTSNGFENVPTQKLLWCINFLTTSKTGDFSSEPGQMERTKFFSTRDFWIRLIFIWTQQLATT